MSASICSSPNLWPEPELKDLRFSLPGCSSCGEFDSHRKSRWSSTLGQRLLTLTQPSWQKMLSLLRSVMPMKKIFSPLLLNPRNAKCSSVPLANLADHFRMRRNLLSTWMFLTSSTNCLFLGNKRIIIFRCSFALSYFQNLKEFIFWRCQSNKMRPGPISFP